MLSKASRMLKSSQSLLRSWFLMDHGDCLWSEASVMLKLSEHIMGSSAYYQSEQLYNRAWRLFRSRKTVVASQSKQ